MTDQGYTFWSLDMKAFTYLQFLGVEHAVFPLPPAKIDKAVLAERTCKLQIVTIGLVRREHVFAFVAEVHAEDCSDSLLDV